MPKPDTRRDELIDPMADFVLAHGLARAALRPLAAAAGTSDRMLLYYFRDRDEVLAAVLDRLAERLETNLAQALPTAERLNERELARQLGSAMLDPSLAPYGRLWMELASSAGEGPERAAAQRIAARFHEWAAARVEAPPDLAGAAAARVIALVDGAVLLANIGREDLARLAFAT